MKLIIDRSITKKGFYTIQFGPDFDIFIFQEEIWMSGVPFEVMSEIDKIVTKSAELKFCVLYIKHKLLLDYDENNLSNNFFIDNEYKQILRNYFAVRLTYRKYDVKLIEIGKKLF